MSAFAMVGTAVFKIVVSSDSMKNATATSQGKSPLLEADGKGGGEETLLELAGVMGFVCRSYFTNEPGNLLTFENLF